MPGFNVLGANSRTYILKHESHKQHEAFTAAAALPKGVPVKLDADGRVSAWVSTDTAATCIGITVTVASAAGEMVTVAVRGYIQVFALSAAAFSAGPITVTSYNAAKVGPDGTTGWLIVDDMADAAAIAAGQLGWALDPATAADQLIRVLVRD